MADPPARAAQQARKGNVAHRVFEHAQQRNQVDDFRHLEQPAQPYHFEGDVARAQLFDERPEQALLAAQDRDLAPRRRSGGVCARDLLGDACGFGRLVGPQADGDRAVAEVREVPQDLVRGTPLRRHVVDQLVRQRQDAGAGTEVDLERQDARLRSVALHELLGEHEKVVQAGAAPRVDVLVGVADGHHRVAVRHQPLQHPRLRDVRVLVLVEQREPVARQEVGHDARVGGDLAGETDLVAVVEHAARFLRLLVGLDDAGELDALPGRVDDLGGDLVCGVLDILEELLVPRDDLARIDQVVRAVVGELPDVRDVPERTRLHVLVRARGVQLRAQLPGLRFAEQRGARLDPRAQSVVGDKSRRERVVRRHRRLFAVRKSERPDRVAHATEQAFGGFVGEREAEDLVRLGVSVHDQPHDARSHHGGLAGARAGDQDARFQRRADRGPLLLRRPSLAERLVDLDRRVGDEHARGHSGTSSPSGQTGHNVLKRHHLQSAPADGANRSARMPCTKPSRRA